MLWIKPQDREKRWSLCSNQVRESQIFVFTSFSRLLQKILKKEVMPLKRKQVQLKVTTVGEPDICKLSESEQKAFYVSMLMRILDKRRQQLEEQSANEHSCKTASWYMKNSYINFALCKIMFTLNCVINRHSINKNTMKTKNIYRLSHRERKRKLRFVKGKMYAWSTLDKPIKPLWYRQYRFHFSLSRRKTK